MFQIRENPDDLCDECRAKAHQPFPPEAPELVHEVREGFGG